MTDVLGGVVTMVLPLWPALGLFLLGWFGHVAYDKLMKRRRPHGKNLPSIRAVQAKRKAGVASPTLGRDRRPRR